jgi:NADH dehydrogenase [ubiquinone] 1 alpha subcomplex assembly factor 6
MMTLLRALPYHASQRCVVIPAGITARHGLVHEEVFRRGGEARGMRDAVWEFASAANDQLNVTRKVFREVVEMRREAIPVFLAAVGRGA